MPYRRTTVEIDIDELSKAEVVLGTSGIKETVNGALKKVNRRASLEQAARYVLDGEMHVPDEATWSAWRKARGSPGS